MNKLKRLFIIGLVGITAVVAIPVFAENWALQGSNVYNNNTGNVGIGTTAPNYKLEVSGGYTVIGKFNVNGTTRPASSPFGGVAVSWNYNAGQAETDFWNLYNNAGTSFQFFQKTGESTHVELMTLKGNGNVGIGTTAPDSTLHVAGGALYASPKPGQANWTSAVFSNNSDATIRVLHTGGVSTLYTDSAAQAINFSTNGSSNSRFYVSGGGNVGIGTKNPGAKLEVAHTSAGAVTLPLILTNAGASTDGSGVGLIFDAFDAAGATPTAKILNYRRGASDYPLTFNVIDGSVTMRERMRIDAAGNVGIGTTSPGAKLDVTGAPGAAASIIVRSGGNTAGDAADIDFTSLNGTVNARIFTTPSNKYTRIKSDGVLSLHAGSSGFDSTNEFVTILTSGNVGIKTASPTQALEVNGNIKTSGSIVSDGDICIGTCP